MTRPEAASHEEAALLLPWLVNGTLNEFEEQRLRAHSNVCVVCRRELSRLEALQRALAASGSAAPVPEPDMRSINRRIDERETRGSLLRRLSGLVTWIEKNPWRAVAAAQALLIAALIPVLVQEFREQPVFETLTTDTAPLPDDVIRVAFAPSLDVSEIEERLSSLELVAVSGPSRRNVYTVKCGRNGCDTTASRLRADPDVLFAEPVVRRED